MSADMHELAAKADEIPPALPGMLLHQKWKLPIRELAWRMQLAAVSSHADTAACCCATKPPNNRAYYNRPRPERTNFPDSHWRLSPSAE